jgi:flagellar hook assembly protein FlgD
MDLQTALVDPSAADGSVTSYPNPFHPDEAPATIAYKLAADARVSLRIYSLLGLEVLHAQIAEGTTGGLEGLNEYRWDGRSDSGRPVASGGYTLVIEAERDGETLHVMRHRIGVVR